MATAIQKLVTTLNNSRAFPAATVIRWANRAERDVAIKTGCLRNIDSVSTTASTRTLVFSGHRVAAAEYVPASGSRRALFKIVPRLVGRMRVDSGEPKGFFQWGSRIGIEPVTPAATAYNINLYINDYPEIEMVQATDSPSIPTDFEDLIVIYGQFMAALKERRWSKALSLYSEYRRQIFEKGYSESNVPDSRAGLSVSERPQGKVK